MNKKLLNWIKIKKFIIIITDIKMKKRMHGGLKNKKIKLIKNMKIVLMMNLRILKMFTKIVTQMRLKKMKKKKKLLKI